ncbi:uncharacterized protein LOC119281099 isoform X2 [Triticum dicoccoides]|uniref:uncharacterized protein LOC119281099 isoform X2 n=1 Tax=Triticum dicoccoides TaxID=85692 RepID=UPI00188EC445|nr:uncharacterized protein LOC119281099 isoform X2 [Triticum dicoccoides]
MVLVEESKGERAPTGGCDKDAPGLLERHNFSAGHPGELLGGFAYEVSGGKADEVLVSGSQDLGEAAVVEKGLMGEATPMEVDELPVAECGRMEACTPRGSKQYSFESKCCVCHRQPSKLGNEICRRCVIQLKENFVLKNINDVLFDMEECKDIYDDTGEVVEDQVFYCPVCGAFVISGHESTTGHETVTIKRRTGQWCALVTGEESWAPIFDNIQALEPFDNLAERYIPLHCATGRKCKACINCLSSLTDLFCTFQCKAASGEIDLLWTEILLQTDFSESCQLDKVCKTFPHQAFCSHCCPGHHKGKGIREAVKNDPASKFISGTPFSTFIASHDKSSSGHCCTSCMRCMGLLTESETAFHACFYNIELANLQIDDGSGETEFEQDSFCIDCMASFCGKICQHHNTHQIIGGTSRACRARSKTRSICRSWNL